MSAASPDLAERTDHEVVCDDGWRLAAAVVNRPGPRAVAICGHAMMVDRRTMDARGAGLVSALAARGVAVVWPDLRGHGASGPLPSEGGSWCYDDLVERDTPALYRFARERFPGLPLFAVGHSLFGHVSLAHAARHPEAAPDGFVLLAANIWLPGLEPSPLRWLGKRALFAAATAVGAPLGRVPARRLRMGSADESWDYFGRFPRWAARGDWTAADGFSYFGNLGRIDRPALAIAAAGDLLFGVPACVRAFVAPLPHHRFLLAGRAGDIVLPFDPDHMGIVTDPRSRPVWEKAADFVLGP